MWMRAVRWDHNKTTFLNIMPALTLRIFRTMSRLFGSKSAVSVRSCSQPGLWQVPAGIIPLFEKLILAKLHNILMHGASQIALNYTDGWKKPQKENWCSLAISQEWRCVCVGGGQCSPVHGCSWERMFMCRWCEHAFIYTLQQRINLIGDDYTRSGLCTSGFEGIRAFPTVQTVYTHNLNVSTSCSQSWHHSFMSPHSYSHRWQIINWILLGLQLHICCTIVDLAFAVMSSRIYSAGMSTFLLFIVWFVHSCEVYGSKGEIWVAASVRRWWRSLWVFPPSAQQWVVLSLSLCS